MPKDPRKWKGRAVVDEDVVESRMRAKEEAAAVAKLKEMSEALQKFKKQKAKEQKMKMSQKNLSKRMQQLGVFRALISGVSSMQVKLAFTKWVEYVETLKEERMEAYRRLRWQLSCPHYSGGQLMHSSGFVQTHGGPHSAHMQNDNMHGKNDDQHHHARHDDALEDADLKRKLKYLVEGDEECGADLELRSTHLPLRLPRLGGRDTLRYGRGESSTKSSDAWQDIAGMLPGGGDTSRRSSITSNLDALKDQHGKHETHGVHREFGFDPAIMHYQDRGFHHRTGRPVYVDSKYKLFKYVYDKV